MATATTNDPEVRKANLAKVLADNLPLGNVQAWAATMVDPKELLAPAVANKADNPLAYARAVVDRLDAAGKLDDALADLRRNARSGPLVLGVQSVIRGEPLDAGEERQAFSRKVQPLFSSGRFQDVYDRLLRTVCAVGVVAPEGGKPCGKILGSGFLVAPDLIMTNTHVIERALTINGGEYVEDPECTVYAFFDYLRPPEPCFDPEPTSCRMVAAKTKGWLVSARPPLACDGRDNAGPWSGTELDYALIRLDVEVGKLPVRRGGGPPRGWLPLPDGELPLLNDRPLFVFQHPQAQEQSWDMGSLAGLDHTSSRARYQISTAHGSSGGATVDADGRLFALHVAEVDPPTRRLNQGVRIDLIVKDLRAQGHDTWPDPSEIGKTSADFWSLRDDAEAPVPIIGRKAFRQAVLASERSGSNPAHRAFVCRGRTGSGRRFTVALLRRLLGPGVPVVQLGAEHLASDAKSVTQLIATQLNIDDGLVPPDPLPTEDLPRWWLSLPVWLGNRLSAAGSSVPLPAWVVVNGVLADDQTEIKWGEGVRELIRAMLDPGGAAGGPLPGLRWLFVGGSQETFPVPSAGKFDELLPDPDTFRRGSYDPATFDKAAFDADFEECLRTAWWAVAPEQAIPDGMLPTLKEWARRDPTMHPVQAGAKMIADLVRNAK